jgi:hypothetical protein
MRTAKVNASEREAWGATQRLTEAPLLRQAKAPTEHLNTFSPFEALKFVPVLQRQTESSGRQIEVCAI